MRVLKDRNESGVLKEKFLNATQYGNGAYWTERIRYVFRCAFKPSINVESQISWSNSPNLLVSQIINSFAPMYDDGLNSLRTSIESYLEERDKLLLVWQKNIEESGVMLR